MKRVALGFVVLVVVTAAVGGAVYLFTRSDPPPSHIDATTAPELPLRQVWVFAPPGAAPGPAAIDPHFGRPILLTLSRRGDGPVPRGVLHALDPETGDPLWTFDAGGTLLPSRVAPWSFNKVMVGESTQPGGGGRAFALDPDTGQQRWALKTADHVTATPTAHADDTYIPAGDDGLYAVDTATGQVRWRFAEDVHVASSASAGVSHDPVIFGTAPSTRFTKTEVIALRKETGTVAWRSPIPLPAAPLGPFTFGDDLLVLLGARGDKAGGLANLDPQTGAVRWVYRTAGPVTTVPSILTHFGRRDEQIRRAYIGSEDGVVHAVELRTGRAGWTASVGGPVVGKLGWDERGGLSAVTATGRVVVLERKLGGGVCQFDLAALAGGRVNVLAASAGPRSVIVAEVETPPGPVVRVYRVDTDARPAK